MNGLLYPLQLKTLRRKALCRRLCDGRPTFDAGPPWAAHFRPVQRWGLRAADGFLFTGRDLATPWTAHGLIATRQPIFEIMEGSYQLSFKGRDRAAARNPYGH